MSLVLVQLDKKLSDILEKIGKVCKIIQFCPILPMTYLLVNLTYLPGRMIQSKWRLDQNRKS